MKRKLLSHLLASCILLQGCGGSTPSCADQQTIEVLDEAIEDEVKKYADSIGLDTLHQLRELSYTYELSHVRTLEHDKDTDSFQCDARITYKFNGSERQEDFYYRVDTDQIDGGVVVEYELTMLKPIPWFFSNE